MYKKVTILCSFLFISLHAMELSHCWFNNKMPLQALNRIAHYLTFYDRETKEEFIARTTLLKKPSLPHSWIQRLPHEYNDPQRTIIASCPNQIMYKLAYNGDTKYPHPHCILLTIDTKNNDQLYEDIDSELKNYEHLAVSRHGTLYATIHANILTIKNHLTQQTETFTIDNVRIPATDEYTAIAFNKESTHIIVHGINLINSVPQYIIFPITIADTQHFGDTDTQKTLDEYFRQNAVCKHLKHQMIHSFIHNLKRKRDELREDLVVQATLNPIDKKSIFFFNAALHEYDEIVKIKKPQKFICSTTDEHYSVLGLATVIPFTDKTFQERKMFIQHLKDLGAKETSEDRELSFIEWWERIPFNKIILLPYIYTTHQILPKIIQLIALYMAQAEGIL